MVVFTAKIGNHEWAKGCFTLDGDIDLDNFTLASEYCQLRPAAQLAVLKENYGIMAVPVFLLRKLQMLLE